MLEQGGVLLRDGPEQTRGQEILGLAELDEADRDDAAVVHVDGVRSAAFCGRQDRHPAVVLRGLGWHGVPGGPSEERPLVGLVAAPGDVGRSRHAPVG